MAIIVITYFGERVTIRNKSRREALKLLAKRGLRRDQIASIKEVKK